MQHPLRKLFHLVKASELQQPLANQFGNTLPLVARGLVTSLEASVAKGLISMP